jgi:hypothetical protein
MAALSLLMAAQECRQMGRNLSPGELSAMLQGSFKPHHNRGKMQNRVADLALGLQAALSLKQTSGIRTSERKQKQADARMDLALSCAEAIIGVRANEMKPSKQTQEQKGSSMAMEMG